MIERLAGPQALQAAIAPHPGVEDGQDDQDRLASRLRATLTALIQHGDLLIFDNYESVLTPDPGVETAAAVARLPWLALDRGAQLLLTSRAHPAGLPGERLIPDRNGMTGLARDAAADLFLHHSPKAREGRDMATHRQIAERVAEETEGYPIAVQLLAAAYDVYDGDPQRFLAEWPRMLAEARARTPDPRHARFAAAVEFSLRPLTPEERERLLALARLDFPFFAEAAALLWDLPTDSDGAPTEEALDAAQRMLGDFTRRSLVQVEGYFSDDEGNPTDRPATYRFQPALRQELLRRGDPGAPMPAGYAAYGAWLAQRAYGELGRSPALANLVYRSMPALEAAAGALAGEARLWHLRRLASFRRHFGDLNRAREELEGALDAAAPATAVRGALLYELAGIMVVQGELERAMALYQESLAIKEALKDQQGKSATLHAMAAIYRVQGELERAMALYQESLAIAEALKDQQGKSATLSMMADVYMARQEWDAAATALIQALDLACRLNDQSGIAFATVKLGQVAQAQGDAATALARYREGLAIFERLRMPRETQQVRELIATLTPPPLSEAIAAWIRDTGDDRSRLQSLVALLNRIAEDVVRIGRANDAEAAEQLAQALIPLRLALRAWTAAAQLPPFNAFLGCLQALLRGETRQLARLRADLDEGLAAALAEVERRLTADEPTPGASPHPQIAQVREQLAAAMPRALDDHDRQRRAQFAQQLEQMATQSADGEQPYRSRPP